MRRYFIFIDDNPEKPEFPFIALTVSGGHTQLLLVKDYENFVELGTTLDDAAGEAFDKSENLELKLPRRSKIDELSKGDFNKFKFPKPKVDRLNFSFPDLKQVLRISSINRHRILLKITYMIFSSNYN